MELTWEIFKEKISKGFDFYKDCGEYVLLDAIDPDFQFKITKDKRILVFAECEECCKRQEFEIYFGKSFKDVVRVLKNMDYLDDVEF